MVWQPSWLDSTTTGDVMEVKLIVNNGMFIFTTFHTVSPQLDQLVRQLVKDYGEKRVALQHTTAV